MECPKNSKIDGGIIPAGFSCPYTNECGDFKDVACNFEGCPVSNGKAVGNNFSCAAARAFDIFSDIFEVKNGTEE